MHISFTAAVISETFISLIISFPLFLFSVLIIGKSNPAPNAKFKYVLFNADLFGIPKEIFDTPNIVLHPNFSFPIFMAFIVSIASLC